MFTFNTNTIDSILKDFTVKIDQLKNIANVKLQDAGRYDLEAKAAADKCKLSRDEAARASSIAQRIEALVG